MTEKRLQGKTALITGAGSGIGRESAILFAQHGANVIIVDLNGFSGEETTEIVSSQGANAFFINCNLSKEKDCEKMFKEALAQFKRIDIIFNNAGIMHYHDGNIIDIDEKIWDMTLAANLKSTFFSCKYGIPSMLKSGGGSIINMSSFTTLQGSATSNMAYNASKAAITALTKDLAAKYADKGIRLNALCPGPTFTQAFQQYISSSDEIKANYLNRIPMRRFAAVDEIARAALFLAGEESTYITGTSFIVDGGSSLAR